LFEGIKCNREKLDLQELDLHINDEAFAEAAAQRLIAMLSEANRSVRAYNDGSVN
jgi:hypothetical protein